MTKKTSAFQIRLTLSTALMSILFVACSKARLLQVYPYPADDLDQTAIYYSPVVFVGYAFKDEDLGIERRVDWDHRKQTSFALHRVKVRVENVLEGQLSSEDHDVYYFTFNGPYSGPIPLGAWENPLPGPRIKDWRRRIFFCKWDHGLLRLACDGFNSCTDIVASGRHPENPALKGADLRQKIAHIQLTKGEGVSDRQFANNLMYSCRFLYGCSFGLPQMRDLLHSSNLEIKVAACRELEHWESQIPLSARYEEIERICKGLVRDLK